MATAQNSRSAAEIRESIERNRAQLSDSLVQLREEVGELTDWRAHLRRNQPAVAGVVVGVGFVLAGGIGSLTKVVVNQVQRLRRSGDA